MERSIFLEDSESRCAGFGERYFLVFWNCTGAAIGLQRTHLAIHLVALSSDSNVPRERSHGPADASGHKSDSCGQKPDAKTTGVSRNNVVLTLLVCLYLWKRFQGLHAYHFFYRTAAPGSAVFP